MILSIDPSPTRHAWALLIGPAGRPTLHGFGRDLATLDPFCITSGVHVIIEMPTPSPLAGASVLDTCVAVGELLFRFGLHRRPPQRIARHEVKRLLLGRCAVKGADAKIRANILRLFGVTGDRPPKGHPLHGVTGDCWAAIAVGLAAMDPRCRFYVPSNERAKQ